MSESNPKKIAFDVRQKYNLQMSGSVGFAALALRLGLITVEQLIARLDH